MKVRRRVLLVLCSMLMALVGTACPPEEGELEVGVKFDKRPNVNEPVEVTVSVKAVESTWWHAAVVEIALPPGAVYIRGLTSSRFEALEEGNVHEFTAPVVFPKEGMWRVDAYAGQVWRPEGYPVPTFQGSGSVLTAGSDEAKVPTYRPYLSPGSEMNLVNEKETPRLIVIQSLADFGEMERAGMLRNVSLANWDMRRHKLFSRAGTFLTDEIRNERIYLMLVDAKRPTTGYRYSLDTWTLDGGELGNLALNISTGEPRPEWQVQDRAVSAYQMVPLLIRDFDLDGVLHIGVNINGKEAGSVALAHDGLQGITLASSRALPGFEENFPQPLVFGQNPLVPSPTPAPTATSVPGFSREPTEISLSDAADFTLSGGPGETVSGKSIAVGDVNGDGVGDLIVGAPSTSFDGRARAGAVHVLFGPVEAGGVIAERSDITIRGRAQATNSGPL